MRNARALTRSWPALGAWGAGLIEIALGAGALTGDGGTAVRIAGVVLVAGGVVALAWGAVTLARGRIVVPRASVAGVLAGLGALTLALVADPVHSSILAIAVAAVLLIAVAACAAASRRTALRRSPPGDGGRRDTVDHPPGNAHSPASTVVGIFTGAFGVALLVVPALAASATAQLATDDGRHTVTIEHHH